MNYTENYHLPQWEESDRVMRVDFNQMCADMEDGLTKNAAEASSDSAKAAASAAAAQSTADTAVAKANAAQKTADAAYCPSFQPYVTGTYTGTDADQTVTLGFRPKFIIVTCADSHDAYLYTMAVGSDTVRLVFTSTGFTVKPLYIADHALQPPHVNEKGRKYAYIAFR